MITKKKAVIAFIEDIKERGVREIGWWYNVLKDENFDLNWAFELLQKNHELIGDKGDIKELALQSYIDDIDCDDELELYCFSKLVDYFIDKSAYNDTLEELEKNNGAEK